ncbi:4a-hydroxytetrahydrobiopterin dehydratase [Dechloromonas denitrificans]|uniref:4a-hydroxytetrahydrobiopterin dehydratase n=1 Tax=Dechloromonas denitrificans TaxID=281362 RepID=UPI001CF91687|nr:4a-hydroxytetrahydrobiopterin dehydratase [Dechloromonas denitrificans]UCV03264.1 4a-hydroxytetrahydrobiopterin dehydratase [Dechloromonas denitrificans]
MHRGDLLDKRCQPCTGGTPPLSAETSRGLLEMLPGWALRNERLEKLFAFKNHYEVMAFVNAIAWVSHRENHHPELTVGYKDCRVCYSTHAINGLSENDFICAAKLERLREI